jgi:TonB family protein
MKRSIILSSFLHLAVIASLVAFSPMSRKSMEGYPTIYRVGLVSLPSGGRAGRAGQAAEQSSEQKVTISSKPEPQEKGVSVKEFQKTKTKKKKTKVTPNKAQSTSQAKKPATTDKKPEGKVTEGDELGQEYGLGDGISAATVDGAGFGSSYYLALVFGRIRDLWDNPVEASATLRVTVYFKIMREGQIIDAQVEKSSGIDLFDEAAKRAVLSGAPLPPLPSEYTGSYLGIHLEFEYVQ